MTTKLFIFGNVMFMIGAISGVLIYNRNPKPPPMNQSWPHKVGEDVYKHTIEGHDYLIYTRAYRGGITHSESCTNVAHIKE